MRKVDRVFVAEGQPLATAFVGLRVPMTFNGTEAGEAVVIRVERGVSVLPPDSDGHRIAQDGVYVDLEYEAPSLFEGAS